MSRLWPAVEAPEPWQGVVRQLYGHLPGKGLLYTAAAGGKWLTGSQVLLPDAACLEQQQEQALQQSQQQQQQDADAEVYEQQWLGPLGRALLLLGVPLVALPPGVVKMMQKYMVGTG